MTLNRTIQPELKKPENIAVIQAKKTVLDNGLTIYVIDAGDSEVVKLELIFPSGATDPDSMISAVAAHNLADSGTVSKTAVEIAEEFDFYGSFFQAEAGPDYKGFSVYSLTNYFEETVEILKDIVHNATFPARETAIWKQRNIQMLQVNKEKVSWLAKTNFTRLIFGESHPYGFTPDEDFYTRVESENLKTFHASNYPADKMIVVVSGKITTGITETLKRVLGTMKIADSITPTIKIDGISEIQPSKIRIEKADSIQCGIRIGRKLFAKNHPDFIPMLITNTILGGYFGSRLMSNIREDKGYTYGIGSGIHSFKNAGMFFISTEVGSEVCDLAIREIYHELQRLSDEPVTEQELNLVKNYLTGSFQRSLDGPFALADRFKGLKLHDLDYDFFNKYMEILNNITPQEVQSQAAKYLKPTMMSEVIAG